MKFSSAIALSIAPVAMATSEVSKRDGHLPVAVEVTQDTEVVVIWVNEGNDAETKTIQEPPVPVEGEGATHTVVVGGPAGLVFFPDQLHDVPVGDTIIFEFLSQNHTVTQSPFETPCQALDGGMDTGFMANPNNTVVPPPQVAMQVMADTPLWFYCRQGNHCGQGMVFSVNPTPEKTHAMFQGMAIEQNGDGALIPITGGEPLPPPADAPAAPPAAPPAAEHPPAAAPPPAAHPGVVQGHGMVNPDGTCTCFAACDPAGFPARDLQGVNAQGGFGGALPLMVAV